MPDTIKQTKPVFSTVLIKSHVCCMSGESIVRRPLIAGGGDAAVDDTVYTRASPQLALLPRYPVLLQSADTVLGTMSHELVLNPDVLTPGRQYFAKVTVFHKRMTLFS